MMFPQRTNDQQAAARTKPYAMIGAGELNSALWKTGSEASGWRYRFNLFRMSRHGRVSQWFTPADVRSLVKLAKVLAAELAGDGCLAVAERNELAQLAAALGEVIGPKD